MKFSRLLAAVASIGLMATPVMAAAENGPAEIVPASEVVTSDGQQIYGASVILQLGILVALAVVGYFGIKAIGGGNDDDEPASP
jgi:hypothetical protein